MVWRDGLAYAAYNDIVMDVPGAKLNIGSVVIENFRLRQPPVSFVDFFDELIVHPNMPEALAERLAKRALPAMFSAFSHRPLRRPRHLGRGDGHRPSGRRRFPHRTTSRSTASASSAIEGIEGVVQGQGAIELDRFAFGGITFGGYDALTALIAAETASPPVDVSELTPRARLRRGPRPRSPDAGHPAPDSRTPPRRRQRLYRADPDQGLVRRHRPVHPGLGDHRARGPGHAPPPWLRPDRRRPSASRRTTIRSPSASRSRTRITASQDMGSFVMSGALAGLPLSAFDDEEILEALAPQLRLEQARFTFKDDSIVGKGPRSARRLHERAGRSSSATSSPTPCRSCCRSRCRTTRS